MFKAWCDTLGRDVLIWTSDVVGVHNTVEGISIHYLCACGGKAESLTGAATRRRPAAHLPFAV